MTRITRCALLAPLIISAQFTGTAFSTELNSLEARKPDSFTSPWVTVAVALIGVAGSFAVAFLTTRKQLKFEHSKLDAELAVQRAEYALQDSAERVAKALLEDSNWRLRSFKVIRHHLGGFGDSELRKILVRAGAVRFMSKSGVELWGMLERNRDRLGITRVDRDPANENDGDLFDADGNPLH